MLIVYVDLIFYQTVLIFYVIIHYTKLLSKFSVDNALIHELYYSLNEVKHIFYHRSVIKK